MRHALTIKGYILVATHRSRNLEVSLQAASSRSQVDDGVEAAPVGLELRDLFAGDDAADLAILGLDHNRSSFDRDRRLSCADFESEINAPAVTYIEHDSGRVGQTKAGRLHFYIVVSDRQRARHILASLIARQFTNLAGCHIGNRDRGIRDYSSRAIADGANQCGFLREGVSSAQSEEYTQCGE